MQSIHTAVDTASGKLYRKHTVEVSNSYPFNPYAFKRQRYHPVKKTREPQNVQQYTPENSTCCRSHMKSCS